MNDYSSAAVALVSAIIGGLFTMWAATHQISRQRKRRVAALEASLATEIAILVDDARSANYGAELRSVVLALQSPDYKGEYSHYFINATQAYFSVYEANAADIGELEPHLAVQVIAFYQRARAWLDGVSKDMVPKPDDFTREELIERFAMLADTIDKLISFGDSLSSRLAPSNLSAHILHVARHLNPIEAHRETQEYHRDWGKYPHPTNPLWPRSPTAEKHDAAATPKALRGDNATNR